MADPSVVLCDDVDLGTVEVVLAGPWNGRVRIDLAVAVRKGLTEHPRALLLNLAGCEGADWALVGAVLLAERESLAARPSVPLLAIASPAQRGVLTATGVTARVPIFETADLARAALGERSPPLGRVALHLSPTVLAPSAARIFVGDTVLAWELGATLHPARMIVSELVDNAVEHAGTPLTVTVSRRGSLLHLAVEDGVATPPRVIDGPGRSGAPLELRGNGLRIVASAAVAWGTTPTAGGKVVWATLRAHPPGVRM
ncbi:ATP-binding protein [Dactylosporangium salmoneum]|uniref:Histidine kinase/HSP90-like ATPase domain-containing protein n=1 Tax=Dactylosporangium salmoneum TaxID=53361 RepID=A0ABP5UQA1_9ACTN